MSRTALPAPAMIERALLTQHEAAQLLGMSESSFKRLNRRGAIGPEPVRLTSKLVRWSRDALLDWASEGCPHRKVWANRKAAAQ